MKPAKTETTNPPIHLAARGAARIKAGHVWVYRSDIKEPKEQLPTGTLVAVLDEKGRILGDALYSTKSQIAIRMFNASREETLPDELADVVSSRVAAAIAYRDEIVRDGDSCRLVFSEADFLPGLIIDRYNDILTTQVLTQAMDREDLRQAVLGSLREHFPSATVYERVEERIRELEDLPPKQSGFVGKPEKGAPKTSTIFTLNGIRFHYDVSSGQKTGAFLDQRENYAAAAQYARGKALDVFTYHGGFALHLYQNCQSVVGVDISRPALEVAEENASLNEYNLDWIEANAFDYMKDQSTAGATYDTIVLDPPAFAKTRKTLDTAIRGYKELNLRALKMLRPGGTLVTCSCSFHVTEPEFLEMLATAAADAHRRLRILERRNASKDHPILLGVPETNYLKCVIARVE